MKVSVLNLEKELLKNVKPNINKNSIMREDIIVYERRKGKKNVCKHLVSSSELKN